MSPLMSSTSGRRSPGAFIPRTLAELEAGGPGRAAVLRAALIVSLLALAIFAILTVSIGASQVDLAVGDVAQADVRAPETVTYQSTIATDQARQLAADQVPAVYAAIRPRADIATEQLDALDGLAAAVSNVLAQKEAGGIDPAEVPAAIRRVAPRLTEAQAAVVASMPQARWDAIAAAARTVVELPRVHRSARVSSRRSSSRPART